jgi:hypothetical protein
MIVAEQLRFREELMAKSTTVEHESKCWIILFKDAEHAEYKAHNDVFLEEEMANSVATMLATSYAKEFHKNAEFAEAGFEYVCKVEPFAEWRVQQKRILIPKTPSKSE